jgi:hypothetical protein
VRQAKLKAKNMKEISEDEINDDMEEEDGDN